MIPRLVTDSLETVKRVCSKALLIFTTGSTFPKSSSPSSSLSRMQRLALPSSYVPLLLKHPERLALMGEGTEKVEKVLHRLSKDSRLRETVEKMAEEEEWVLALGLGRFQRRMLVAVTSLSDTLLDYALAIAKPTRLTISSWLQELALTLYTKWVAVVVVAHSIIRLLPGPKLSMISFSSMEWLPPGRSLSRFFWSLKQWKPRWQPVPADPPLPGRVRQLEGPPILPHHPPCSLSCQVVSSHSTSQNESSILRFFFF